MRARKWHALLSASSAGPPQALRDLGVPLGAVPGDGTGMFPLPGWDWGHHQPWGGKGWVGTSSPWGHLLDGDILLGMSPFLGTSPRWGHLLLGWGHLLVGDISLMAWGCPHAGCQPRGLLERTAAPCTVRLAAGSGTAGSGTARCPEGLSPQGFVTLRLHCAQLRAPGRVCWEWDHQQPSPRAVQDGAARVPTVAHPSSHPQTSPVV